MLNTADRLARSDAVRIVGIGVIVKGLKLTTLFPSQSVTEVLNRVTLNIVLDSLSIKAGEQVFPRCITVGISLTVLFDDVTIVVILHGVDDRAVARFGQKLAECVIGIFGHTLNTIGYFGNSFLGVVLVREGTAARQCDLADELSCGRRYNLVCCIISFLRIKVNKNSAPHKEVRRKTIKINIKKIFI